MARRGGEEEGGDDNDERDEENEEKKEASSMEEEGCPCDVFGEVCADDGDYWTSNVVAHYRTLWKGIHTRDDAELRH
jgi:hypothetical protein